MAEASRSPTATAPAWLTDPELRALREELLRLLRERALRTGEFVLSSGRRSTYYLDGKQVTLDGRGLHLVARLLLARCRQLGATAIGGLTLGADPIAAAVAALSGAEAGVAPPPLRAFLVRKQAKDHGTGRAIEGPALGSSDRVVVVDDVVTTGRSLLLAADQVLTTGATIVEAICVVDREEGAAAALAERGISLQALVQRQELLPEAPLGGQ